MARILDMKAMSDRDLDICRRRASMLLNPNNDETIKRMAARVYVEATKEQHTRSMKLHIAKYGL